MTSLRIKVALLVVISGLAAIAAVKISSGRYDASKTSQKISESKSGLEVDTSPIDERRIQHSSASEPVASRVRDRTFDENVDVTQPLSAEPNVKDVHDGKEASTARDSREPIDERVIGREFPISESLRKACEDELSVEDLERIERFAGEPRDRGWAAGAEELLYSMIEARSPDFAARRIECRKTVCLMEVESRLGAWQEIPPSKEWHRLDVKPRIFVFESEYLNSGTKMTRSLWIYERLSTVNTIER